MEKLQWDSEFWGVNVFHLAQMDKLDLDELDSDSYLVQALPNESDLNFIHALESNGFRFQENKVNLSKNNICKAEIKDSNFRALSSSDLMLYKDGFFELYGKNTRYCAFPPKKINEFYFTWLTNSAVGQMDDVCIGYFINDELAGFITYKTRNNYIIIGLLGVLPNHRGCGISQVLLNYVNNVALKTLSDGISVSTQGKNISAINAYIKNGYHVASIDQWYYLIKGELK